MSEGASSVRCYQCGTTVPVGGASCEECGAMQTALCEECGATFSGYEDACPECGFDHDPFEYRPRVTFLRILLVVLLVVAVAGAVLGWRHFRKNEGRERREAFAGATRAYIRGEYGTAREQFERWLDRYGEHPGALYMLALALLEAGREDDAIQRAERALEIRPDYDDAALFLAARMLERDEPGAALTFAKQALATGAKPVAAHVLVGTLLSRPEFRDLSGAVRHLRAAVAGGAGDAGLLLLLADLAEIRGRALPGSESRTEIAGWRRRAAEQIERRLSGDAGDSDLLFELAQIQAKLGDVSRAVTNLRQSISRGEETVARRVLLGELEWERLNEDGARTIFDTVLSESPAAAVWLRIGRFYDKVGARELADAVMERGVAAHPLSAALRWRQAWRRLQVGDPEAAEAGIRDALSVLPDRLELEVLLAITLEMRGEPAEAEKRLRAAAGREAGPPIAELHLVDLLLETPPDDPRRDERLEEAEHRLNAAEPETGRDDSLSLFRRYLRGKFFLVTGRLGEAIDELSRVSASLADDTTAHYLLAQAHRARGEHDLAALELNSLMRRAGDSPSLLIRRGDSYLRSAASALPLAVRDAEAALAKDPGSEDARLLLARTKLASSPPEPAAAEAVLEEDLSGPSGGALCRAALARLRLAAGDPDGAREWAESAAAAAAGPTERIVALEALAAVSADPSDPWDRYIEDHPGDGEALLRYAGRLLDSGRAGAGAFAERILERDDRSVPARVILFESLFKAEGLPPAAWSRAEKLWSEVAARAPGVPEERYLAGKLRLATGDVEGAVEALGSAVRSEPANPRFRYAFGAALLVAGEGGRAREELEAAGPEGERLLSAPPGTVALRIARARLVEDSADPAARRLLVFALGSIEDLGARVGPALALLAAARAGADPESVGVAARALAAAPDPAPDPPWAAAVAGGLFAAALERDRAGDAEGAEALYRRVLALAPGRPAAAVNLAEILAGRGGPDAAREAVDLARAAVEAEPENGDYRDALGFALLVAGDSKAAGGELDRAVSLRETAADEPALARTLVRRALARAAAGRGADAKADLDRAARLDPTVRGEDEFRRASRRSTR